MDDDRVRYSCLNVKKCEYNYTPDLDSNVKNLLSDQIWALRNEKEFWPRLGWGSQDTDDPNIKR